MTGRGRVSRKHVDRLAKDILLLAEIGGMPDDYWLTDTRIGRAARQLGWTREQCRTWAERNA